MPGPAPVRLLTAAETAELLRIDLATVYRLIRERKLRAVCIGRRKLVRPSDLDQFLADQSTTRPLPRIDGP